MIESNLATKKYIADALFLSGIAKHVDKRRADQAYSLPDLKILKFALNCLFQSINCRVCAYTAPTDLRKKTLSP